MITHVVFGTCTQVRLIPFLKQWQACHQADILLLKLRLQLTQFAVFSMQLLLPLQDCSLPLCNLLLTGIQQKCVSYDCAGSNPPISYVILTGHKVPPSSSVESCLAAELQLLPRESSAACSDARHALLTKKSLTAAVAAAIPQLDARLQLIKSLFYFTD